MFTKKNFLKCYVGLQADVLCGKCFELIICMKEV